MKIEYFHAGEHGSGAMARKRRSSVRRAGFRVALISATMFAFGLIVPPSGGATPSSGPLSTHTCTVDNMAARCGTLMVPQDRITRTGPEIPIRVVVIPATGPDRQPDPIVFFAGGPGSSAIDMMSEELPLFAVEHEPRPRVHRSTWHRGLELDLPELSESRRRGRSPDERRVLLAAPEG